MGRRIARIPKERSGVGRRDASKDHPANWLTFYERIFDGIPFRTSKESKGGYRGRRKIRVKWRGWLPNPPIHQSYASHQWRYCFKFVAQPLSRGWRGARSVYIRNGWQRERERERGYEVLSDLSLVRCTTSSRGKTSGVASRA